MDELNQIRTVQGRWMTIDEEIYVALDNDTMSLYTALRYEGDYAQETTKVIKSMKYLCERAKIKKTKGYEALNTLENLGLIKRCNEKRLGEVGLIYVSKHMGYFSEPVRIADTPVRIADTPVRLTDTYQESIQQSIQDNSESCDSPSQKPKNKIKDIQPFIDVWNELAEHTGNPKQGTEKRSLQAIKRNLNKINDYWKIPLSPKNFKAWLSKAINSEFYLLTKVEYLKSMEVCTRWNHFEESLTYINNKECRND